MEFFVSVLLLQVAPFCKAHATEISWGLATLSLLWFWLYFPYDVFPFGPLIRTKNWVFTVMFIAFRRRIGSTRKWFINVELTPVGLEKTLLFVTLFGFSMIVATYD